MTELDIILWLQKASCTFFDYVMYFLTQLGDETFFLILAVVVFWCIDKRLGLKFITVFMIGQMFTAVLKVSFRRPRPYESGASAIITRSSGYSFPSGHSQTIANMAAQTFLFVDKKHPSCRKTALVAGLVATTTVMFTRMYLGQHYLSDVIAGAVLGIIAAIVFSWLFEFLGQREERLVFVFLPLSLFLTAFLVGYGSNVAKVLGVLGAISLGYYLEKRYVGYDLGRRDGRLTKKRILLHGVKVLAGGAVLLAIKEGLKQVGIHLRLTGVSLFVLDYARYFLLGITASLLAPLTFKALKV